VPFDPAAFFQNLGLLPRALFAPGQAVAPAAPSTTPATHVDNASKDLIFLDGVTASFALSAVDDPPENDDGYYDWSWSSNVTHHVEVHERYDSAGGIVLVRRWDNPNGIRRFTLRSIQRHGPDFIAALEQAGPTRGSSVINRALRLLRQVREVMARSSRADACILVFHALLLGAAYARRAEQDARRRWVGAKTLGEALSVLSVPIEVPDNLKDTGLFAVQSGFVESDPASGRTLDPFLLLRHAAGILYEEAHRELDRAENQVTFDFFTPSGGAPTRAPSSVIHFTPPGLARVMAELAWRFYDQIEHEAGRRPTLVDPACGSGSFLLEGFMCAQTRRSQNGLKLHGIDISKRAVEMTTLAVTDAVRSAGGDAPDLVIEQKNSIASDWAADIILMNPPFMAWNDLDEDQRKSVLSICGDAAGRPDLASAFIVRAIDSLRPGGVLASILPSSLLSASSADLLRTKVLQSAEVKVIGRFRGNDIFPNALVEVSIIVAQKRTAPMPASRASEFTTMLLSSPGSSEAALRALRRGTLLPNDAGRYEIYEAPLTVPAKKETAPKKEKKEEAGSVTYSSWLPRPQLLRLLIPRLEASGLPRVGQIFSVKQGIRSGANPVFVLSHDAVRALPLSEREYFRPLAGNKTIEDGKLATSEFIFYPYDTEGLRLKSEADLESKVLRYYQNTLIPAKKELLARAGITDAWWALTRSRDWQHAKRPKMISSYFGRVGKFAFDSTGEYVIGQGFGWIVKDSYARSIGKKSITVDAVTSEIGPAYTALFNSRRFSQLLSYYTYRVMGGQFDLSPRFVNNIPVPDLITPAAVPAAIVDELRSIGTKMSKGHWPTSLDRLDELVASAYGVVPSLWPVDIE
jgi:adenine-specific DNA-methyltransferase